MYRKRPPDGIAEEQKLAAVEKVFRVGLCWFPDFREFLEVELGHTEPCGAHKVSGCAHAPWACPIALLSPHFSSGLLSKLPGSLVQKKTSKCFVAFGLRLDGTRHGVNRLVPENNIK